MGQRRRGKPKPIPAHGLPASFIARTAKDLGNEWPLFEAALKDDPPVSIRLNPAKTRDPLGATVPWCSNGRYLPERPIFTLDPLFHAGAYYVQEAASMLLEQALRTTELLDRPILALDLCAAPGGKSTLIRSLLHPKSLLVANEVERKRQAPLLENLWKWGMPNVVVCGSDPSDLEPIPEFFDLILVDAPCSGEGMFRKDPFARAQWTEALVVQCALLQRRVVEQAWRALKPGGSLIYSTCTWEKEENEERMRQLLELGAHILHIPVDPLWGVTVDHGPDTASLRCYPHRTRGEGFFLGIARKPGVLENSIMVMQPLADHPEVRSWSLAGADLFFTEEKETLYAVDGRWKLALQQLGSALKVIAPGRPMAEMKGKAWRPHAAMALDTELVRGAFPEVELERGAALDYLRGQALPSEDASGLALAVFNNLPLGWLKGAGTRWNNLWPSPWRIRMQGS